MRFLPVDIDYCGHSMLNHIMVYFNIKSGENAVSRQLQLTYLRHEIFGIHNELCELVLMVLSNIQTNPFMVMAVRQRFLALFWQDTATEPATVLKRLDFSSLLLLHHSPHLWNRQFIDLPALPFTPMEMLNRLANVNRNLHTIKAEYERVFDYMYNIIAQDCEAPTFQRIFHPLTVALGYNNLNISHTSLVAFVFPWFSQQTEQETNVLASPPMANTTPTQAVPIDCFCSEATDTNSMPSPSSSVSQSPNPEEEQETNLSAAHLGSNHSVSSRCPSTDSSSSNSLLTNHQEEHLD